MLQHALPATASLEYFQNQKEDVFRFGGSAYVCSLCTPSGKN